MSKICVIIPAYNAAEYLAETLESIRAQTFEDWTAIVFDDGSTDGTGLVAASFVEVDRRIRYFRDENSGISATRNRGASLCDAKAEFLLFLDADDLLQPVALALLAQTLQDAPNAVGAYGLPQFFGNGQSLYPIEKTQAFGFDRKKIKSGRMVTVPTEEDTGFASLVIWPCIATPGQLLIRRSSFLESSGFDEKSPPGEDWDHWLRLSIIGNLKIVREFVLQKRNHTTNVSSTGKRFAECELWTRRKFASMPGLTREQREIARQGHRYSCLIKCSWAYDHLKCGQPVEAIKALYRAGKTYISYVKIWRVNNRATVDTQT